MECLPRAFGELDVTAGRFHYLALGDQAIERLHHLRLPERCRKHRVHSRGNLGVGARSVTIIDRPKSYEFESAVAPTSFGEFHVMN